MHESTSCIKSSFFCNGKNISLLQVTSQRSFLLSLSVLDGLFWKKYLHLFKRKIFHFSILLHIYLTKFNAILSLFEFLQRGIRKIMCEKLAQDPSQLVFLLFSLFFSPLSLHKYYYLNFYSRSPFSYIF